jgi:diguanylate cyclase (GGDEF)-like protein/PAS domain S-box-containing protein
MLGTRPDRGLMKIVSESPESVTAKTVRASCEEALSRLQQALATIDKHSSAVGNLLGAIESIEQLMRGATSLESRYRNLLDAVPDAVTVHDHSGRIVEANQAAVDAYGYSLSELKSLSVFDLNPDLAKNRIDEVWHTFKLGATFTVETENCHRSGDSFPVEVHSKLFVDGNEKRIIAVARSISARRESERAIRESDTRYRQLFDAIDKGIVVQDGKGEVVSLNAAAERLFQLSERTVIEKRFDPKLWRFVDSEGAPLGERDLPPYAALRTGKAVDSMVIGAFNPIANSHSWFNVFSMPQFRNGEERPFQVISLIADVTVLKRQALLFDKVQELAAIGGWEIDFRRDQVFWSDELYRLHGRTPGSALALSDYVACFVASDATRLQRAIEEARSNGKSFDLEARVLTPSGQRRWLRVIGHSQSHTHIEGNLIGVSQDITERKRFEENLRRQSLTDALTGLSNRDDLMRQLTRAIDDAEPGAGPVLLYVDLDRFKVINDLLGHSAGDGLLVAAAQRIRKLAGPDVLVARFDGDEFVLMLTGQPAIDERTDSRARNLAIQITQAFAEPFPHSGEEFTITASVGIAQFPTDGATIQQLINHADAAMFDAKRRGRNNWQQFSPALARKLTDRLLIETQLRRALDNQEFYLHFQPQVDLQSGRVVGAEALLRWRNRLLGELAPDLFISHAETTGDIVRIGAWVIRESCRQLRQWRDSGLALRCIAVNVSYRQFLGENLAETVLAALKEFDLPGEALELEMTERVLIEDVPDTQEIFNTLRGLGVSLVIDDFGEGYSALNYLRRLPFNAIKISHDFMQGIPLNPADTTICEAIIRIAQSLGLGVIAEGVETELQRSFLLKQGATLAQGYLFARPLSAEGFAEYASDRLRR